MYCKFNTMPTNNITYRTLQEKDWKEVSEIYKKGIETGNATFEGNIPTWEEWNENHFSACRIVAETNNTVVGWCALLPISSRSVYKGVMEVSIYVLPDYTGQKIGSTLLKTLISESEENNIWTLQSSIFRENIPSLRIHKKFGFRKVGHRERIGKMKGEWRDTIILERRSTKIGID